MMFLDHVVDNAMLGIISIQSHVVYGCAGNSSAVFPLQRLGFNVWPIHTVQFSNHTQYQAGWTGSILPDNQITILFDGLQKIGALDKTIAVISGYLGSGPQATEILNNVTRIKQKNPRCLYICDPVMGDPKKGCIVSPELTTLLCDYLLPNAQIITPNQFELSQFTGITINGLDSAIMACQKARRLGPDIVLAKHIHYEGINAYTSLMATEKGVYVIERPTIAFQKPPVGVGDLITALFTGHFIQSDDPLLAFEKTNQAVYDILSVTQRLNEYEIQIIAAQDAISASVVNYNATQVS